MFRYNKQSTKHGHNIRLQLIKGTGSTHVLGRFSAFLYRGHNFCYFLFTFQHAKSFLNGALGKESKLFLLKYGNQKHFERFTSPKSVSIFLKRYRCTVKLVFNSLLRRDQPIPTPPSLPHIKKIALLGINDFLLETTPFQMGTGAQWSK